jgi:hypothetical protein
VIGEKSTLIEKLPFCRLRDRWICRDPLQRFAVESSGRQKAKDDENRRHHQLRNQEWQF